MTLWLPEAEAALAQGTDADRGTRALTLVRDFTPKTVTLDITPGTRPLCFLPHSPCHLCYDDLAHEYGVRGLDREDTRWILSRSWIR